MNSLLFEHIVDDGLSSQGLLTSGLLLDKKQLLIGNSYLSRDIDHGFSFLRTLSYHCKPLSHQLIVERKRQLMVIKLELSWFLLSGSSNFNNPNAS